jgi:hypothetical protein
MPLAEKEISIRPGMVVHICNPSTLEAEAGGSGESQGNLGYIAIPFLKNNSNNDDLTTKPNPRAGGVAQVVEHLPSKCEVLSSNPGMAKKKKKSLNKTNEKPSSKEV